MNKITTMLEKISDRYPNFITACLAFVASTIFMTIVFYCIDNGFAPDFLQFDAMIHISEKYYLGEGNMPLYEIFLLALVFTSLPLFLFLLFTSLGIFLVGVFLFVMVVVGFSILVPGLIMLSPVLLIGGYFMYKRHKSKQNSL